MITMTIALSIIVADNFRIMAIGSPKMMAIGMNFRRRTRKKKETRTKDPQTSTITQMGQVMLIKKLVNRMYALPTTTAIMMAINKGMRNMSDRHVSSQFRS